MKQLRPLFATISGLILIAGITYYYIQQKKSTTGPQNDESQEDTLCPQRQENQQTTERNTENPFSKNTTHSEGFYKPVIYLYPPSIQEIKVQLDFQGEIIADYPDYDREKKGWEVIATPEGTLINKADGKSYSYLFREGKFQKTPSYDLTKGFVIPGKETKAFLQKILAEI